MVIIIKKPKPKTPRPGWDLLKLIQTYRAHMGKSCVDAVLCCARDMYMKPQWRMMGRI